MRHSALPVAVEETLAALPHDAHPMGVILTGLAALSTCHPEQARQPPLLLLLNGSPGGCTRDASCRVVSHTAWHGRAVGWHVHGGARLLMTHEDD